MPFEDAFFSEQFRTVQTDLFVCGEDQATGSVEDAAKSSRSHAASVKNCVWNVIDRFPTPPPPVAKYHSRPRS
jgi:hypothetical protein